MKVSYGKARILPTNDLPGVLAKDLQYIRFPLRQLFF